MKELEFRAVLVDMLAEERSPEPDWTRIEALAQDMIRRLNAEEVPDHPVAVYRFFDDVDIRRKDAIAGRREYADSQYTAVDSFLRS